MCVLLSARTFPQYLGLLRAVLVFIFGTEMAARLLASRDPELSSLSTAVAANVLAFSDTVSLQGACAKAFSGSMDTLLSATTR